MTPLALPGRNPIPLLRELPFPLRTSGSRLPPPLFRRREVLMTILCGLCVRCWECQRHGSQGMEPFLGTLEVGSTPPSSATTSRGAGVPSFAWGRPTVRALPSQPPVLPIATRIRTRPSASDLWGAGFTGICPHHGLEGKRNPCGVPAGSRRRERRGARRHKSTRSRRSVGSTSEPACRRRPSQIKIARKGWRAPRMWQIYSQAIDPNSLNHAPPAGRGGEEGQTAGIAARAGDMMMRARSVAASDTTV